MVCEAQSPHSYILQRDPESNFFDWKRLTRTDIGVVVRGTGHASCYDYVSRTMFFSGGEGDVCSR